MSGYEIRYEKRDLEAMLDCASEALEGGYRLYIELANAMSVAGFKETHGSFTANFKDAIMHYRRMYNAFAILPEEEGESCLEIVIQCELLFEHLNRGIIDAYVEILQYLWRTHEALIYIGTIRKDDISSPRYFEKLKENLNICTESLYTLRKSKLEIVRLIAGKEIMVNQDTLQYFIDLIQFITEAILYAKNGDGNAKLQGHFAGISEGADKMLRMIVDGIEASKLRINKPD